MPPILTESKYKFWPDVINDLKRLLETDENYDVIVYVGEEPNVREFHVHSLILGCRSQYFLNLFSKNINERKDECFIFKIPNISSCTFNQILSFIYYGDIDLKKCTGEEILKLIVTASEFSLHKLVQYSIEYFYNNCKEILRNGNSLECLVLSFNHELLSSLQESIIKSICQEPDKIFGTKDFYSLSSNIFEILIKRNDLILDEISIWENLVKWCIYQHKNFENDDDNNVFNFIKNLKQEEINNIKNFLESYIYIINFKKITAQDYLSKVLPYEDLLSKEIKKEVLKSFMFIRNSNDTTTISSSSSSSTTIPQLNLTRMSSIFSNSILTKSLKRNFNIKLDSKLINHLYVKLFATWIDKETEMYNNSKLINYKFRLLFRSSRDGIYGKSFHEKCDNKGPTIIIAKIKETKKLIGGYNPLGWEGNCVKSSTDSFLFSFNDLDDIGSRKIGRIIKPNDAIRCFKGWGPIFGDLNGDSNDLVMTSLGHWSSSSGSYEDVGIPNQFKVEEWEVFQVKKRKV